MNVVLLSGRLTRDPDYMPSEGDKKSVARFALAVQRKDAADFINCTAFEKTADFIAQYFKKGSKILVQGQIRTDTYTNKENVTVNSWYVAVNNAEFAESKKTADNSSEE